MIKFDRIDLKRYLLQMAEEQSAKSREGYFRLSIDRSFLLNGIGLVATGTAISGSVSEGDKLFLLPGNREVRVRAIHSQNQKSATGSTATPENCTDYRDGGFITITFGSTGPCRDGSNSSTYSLLGLYPAGGRYEDGAAKTITTLGALNAGTGALPHQFITYADRLYLQAELINAGVATGTEKTVFSQALDASFLQMDHIITNFIKPGSSGAPQVVPAIATLAATTTYKTAVLAAYDKAATASKRLEFIMTEKWINRIENPVDNWTDYRRTKFPVLFSPAPIGTVTTFASPGAPPTYPPTNVPVSNDRAYPLSLPFDVNEISLNSNALPQKVAEAYRVFWQPVGQ